MKNPMTESSEQGPRDRSRIMPGASIVLPWNHSVMSDRRGGRLMGTQAGGARCLVLAITQHDGNFAMETGVNVVVACVATVQGGRPIVGWITSTSSSIIAAGGQQRSP